MDRRQEKGRQRVVVHEDRVVPADKLVLVYVLQAAGLATENCSRMEAMVRVGRWSNALVRESLVERQRMRSEKLVSPKRAL